ncbi:MAG: type IX secretion system membrane protein PorP/SprF [Tannerellaceae bacterium]|jgi:type IX secretion system PorP/SprF family membrane protein|nr:type IX secretion system membrane protein PorP/SprF [Tannerellaceae bacterium]
MKRLLFFFILCLAGVTNASAQYDAQISQYFLAMGYYNPAFAGGYRELNVFGLHRQQWVGMPGAPQTSFILIDMPYALGKIHTGIGLTLHTETIGLFSNSTLGGQFAWKRDFLGGTLSVGVQIGLVSVAFDGSKVDFGDLKEQESGNDAAASQDEAIPQAEVNGMALDLNAGIYFTHRKFYMGFASSHILEPQMELEENISTYIGRAFNLTAGYNIQLKNSLLELQPSVFMKTDLQSFQMDVTARAVYNKMFSGGISWRGYEAVVMLGASFANIEVGYAYDFPTGALLKAGSGSHELTLRYKVKLNKAKTGDYRHKSVRIL